MASDFRIRYCVNGHTVRDPDAAECPACKVDLDKPLPDTAPLSEPEQAQSTLWMLLIGGGVLMVVGLLVFAGAARSQATEDGTGAGQLVGLALGALGQLMALIGCVGFGVKLGMTASRGDGPTN